MTLREVFDELAGGGEADPAGALADRGYGELPDPLLSEAIVSYADTAPVEVAEHLAPFVMVHSAVPVDRAGDVPAADGLGLLATAPEPIVPGDELADDQVAAEPVAGDRPYEADPALDFDFGHGDFGDGDLADAALDLEAPAAAEPAQAWDATEEFEPAADSWLTPAEPVAADREPDDDSDGDGAAG
jgi:hypothetical protein